MFRDTVGGPIVLGPKEERRGETNSQMLEKIDKFNHPDKQSSAKCYSASALEPEHIQYTSQRSLTCVLSNKVTLSFS